VVIRVLTINSFLSIYEDLNSENVPGYNKQHEITLVPYARQCR